MICPKCGHARSPQDDPNIPDGQCPSCGIYYQKFFNRQQQQMQLEAEKQEPQVHVEDELSLSQILKTTEDSAEEINNRISLTKSQCATETGKELIETCLNLTDDGMLSDDEIYLLRQWINKNIDAKFNAITHLKRAVSLYFNSASDGYKNKKLLYTTIESALPVTERKKAANNRKTLEAEEKRIIKTEKETAKLLLKEEKQRNKPTLSANFMVAGCKHDGRPRIIEKHVDIDGDVILARDKANKYSKNAVKVLTKKGHQIGFVPEFYAEEIAEAIDNGGKYEAFFTKILGYESPIPVVQAYFYRGDSDHGDVIPNSNNKPINLALPIMLAAFAAAPYLLYKFIAWLY